MTGQEREARLEGLLRDAVSFFGWNDAERNLRHEIETALTACEEPLIAMDEASWIAERSDVEGERDDLRAKLDNVRRILADQDPKP